MFNLFVFRVSEAHLRQGLVPVGMHLQLHQGDLRGGRAVLRALPSLTRCLSRLGI